MFRQKPSRFPVIALRTEVLALLASLFFALACNRSFWKVVLAGHEISAPGSWRLALGVLGLLVAVNFVLLSVLMTRWTAKPVLGFLIVGTAFAVYFMEAFGVYLDPSMLRNALKTDFHESNELFTWGMVPYLIGYAVVPLLLLSRVRLKAVPARRAAVGRVVAVVLALVIGGGALISVFQDMASLMRNQKEVRYLITPPNYLYSLARVTSAEAKAADRPREVVGADAAMGPSWAARKKPALFVLVIGETARAANWGLSGYARQTTPELAKLDVINFAKVGACGTNTEVSLPCMLSAIGRRNYDETRIRGSESILHVLARAGFKVQWRDNQSGCKGVCEGLDEVRLSSANVPGICDGERCLDDILLHGLDQVLADDQGNRVIVMHQLGNHGPAYYKRYPAEFRRFLPACENPDLAKCSQEEVVNAYDNALLYTDAMLAKTIAFLRERASKFDTAMIYVSDHGESLGENNLYLHGVPYAIAPRVQIDVPMVMWMSNGFAGSFGVDAACLRQQAMQPVSHDHLFHTLLGLLDVTTSAYVSEFDFSRVCRAQRKDSSRG